MAKKSYDENSVVRVLNRNAGVKVDVINKTIVVVRDASTVGNGTWGKIDYLVNYKGYVQTFTNKTIKKRAIDDDAFDANSKYASLIGKVKGITNIKF